MFRNIKIVVGIFAAAVFASCSQSEGNFAGWEYAPDMYYAKGPEAFRMLAKDTADMYKHMWNPVKNTIARGKLDYYFPYENTIADYERAKKEVMCPDKVPATLVNIQEGKRLFDINCIVCHGPLGKADGTIVKDDRNDPAQQADVLDTVRYWFNQFMAWFIK